MLSKNIGFSRCEAPLPRPPSKRANVSATSIIVLQHYERTEENTDCLFDASLTYKYDSVIFSMLRSVTDSEFNPFRGRG